MSVLTELFVAPAESAKSYDTMSGSRFERVQLGGLTNLEFETLWAIVEGEDWDAEKHALREVTSSENSWVHEFPRRYLEVLGALSDRTKQTAAATWAATEEISSTPAEVSPVIDHLVVLSRSATQKGQGLFVWTSV